MNIVVDAEKKILHVSQEIEYFNESKDTLNNLILNDWNNAYSSKSSLLANRFSDEFIRGFHLANDQERGVTTNITIKDGRLVSQNWFRLTNQIDLIYVELKEKIFPAEKRLIKLTYDVKIPSDKFTKYGYSSIGDMNLKDWFLVPARFENHEFTKYSNANIDDIANGFSDYDITLTLAKNLFLTSDLDIKELNKDDLNTTYQLVGNNRNSFSLFFHSKPNFVYYKNTIVNVATNLEENRLNEIQKALIVDKIVTFTNEKLGKYPYQKITVSQIDYERNPFYGLNQLPAFMSPFSDDFLFEIKFLKTYLNNYLNTRLHLDPRKDHWIYDGIQVYIMMLYIDEYYPESKMMGNVAKLKILKSFNIINLDFNEQYSYFYMLMARKNLDQAIGDPKDSLIKFNEKIAGKYRAGLSLRYLNSYLENHIVSESIQQFCALNYQRQTSSIDFENILKTNTPKNIDWFFETIVKSRKIIDYKFEQVTKTKDSVTITIKNKTQTVVPISIYGLKKKKIVFKQWLENIKTDSTLTLARKDADKLVLNYNNEVPEFNLRNNWKSLKGFSFNNRPFKFVLMKDLEDPYYNQILYVPAFNYNLYDGFTMGMRFHNKTILDKPFTFDIEPLFATYTRSLTGSFSLGVNQYNRDSNLYLVRYGMSGLVSHYAPDASYTKFNPYVSMNFREDDFRKNKKQTLYFREVTVNREKSAYITSNDTENYSVLDARFVSYDTEITKQFSYFTNVQLSDKFGKIQGSIEYRKLFENNRQFNLRLFGGAFLYKNSTSDFFSFALDRPTDYLFDYDYIGRSEKTGIFSQQLIIAEGGFKTKLANPYVNQWITSINSSTNIWNWIEVYGDVSGYKNKYQDAKIVYDSGVRFNLVTDYFELYFPVYSSNGWDISKPNYTEKIRFVISISTSTLINLFTRKWF